MDIKDPKDKHISRWIDREKLIYVNLISKKLQGVLGVSPMQKSFFHLLQDHA